VLLDHIQKYVRTGQFLVSQQHAHRTGAVGIHVYTQFYHTLHQRRQQLHAIQLKTAPLFFIQPSKTPLRAGLTRNPGPLEHLGI
jgi:hypothetical protein